MRVCIITRCGYVHGIGGMQDHTLWLARGLVEAGHEVEVITARHWQGLTEAWHEGARWHFVDAPDRYVPAWLEKSYAQFERIHDERPIDVIHSESAGAIEHIRRGVHRRIPVVVMYHGAALGLAKAALRRALRARQLRGTGLRAVCRRHLQYGMWYRLRVCEAIVPSRQQLTDTRVSFLLKRERIHVVPNGIDTKLFRPRPQAAARAEVGLGPGRLFVCAGRLSSDKGMHHAVRALSLMDGDAKLVIVGEGAEQERLEQLASELGVRDRVIFAGAHPHEVVARYFAAADAFLFPTERDEAAPLVLPEAMACGLPVAASSVGGIVDVIDRPGENGLLLPPANVRALADAMTRLAQDEALRRRLGEAARERVLAQYTVERMTEGTLDVYRIAAARLGKTLDGERADA